MKGNSMKSRVLNIATALLFITGFTVFLYPNGTGYVAEKKAQGVISDFVEAAQEVREVSGNSGKNPALNGLYTDMQAYNQNLYETRQIGLQDPFSYETPAFDLTKYGFEDDMVGYISIPAMSVEMPIYLGASKPNLALGAGNLGFTSVPIGGTNTNTVLAAHRGYRGIAMFRDIETLRTGDTIYVTNFWETLIYEVVETKVILPTDIQTVTIQEGRDMLTLITCHPYRNNYQRYVVYCERTETAGTEKADMTTRSDLQNIFRWNEFSESEKQIFVELWTPIAIVVLMLLFILIRLSLWASRRHK